MAGKTSTRYFRIATEGATTDGRTIDRATLQQMAKNYDRSKYGARINVEHIRGYDPTGPFKAYGDVVALKTEEEGGKLRLYAQLDPTDDLVAFNKARQKVYCSMEVQPDFADSGEAYLVGLAVTDSPASLGCEILKFSATAATNPFAARKQSPGNLFTEAVEVDLDFTAENPPAPDNTLANTIKKLFGRPDKAAGDNDARFTDITDAVKTVAEQVQTMSNQVTELANTVKQVQDAQQTDRSAFNSMRDTLSTTEDFARRPTATGGNGNTVTDC